MTAIAKDLENKRLTGTRHTRSGVEKAFASVAWRTFRLLPLKDRCLLRLALNRGATTAELAGLLGTNWISVRRRLERLVKWLGHPAQQQMLAAWPRLDQGQRRLLYLHRVLGLPLREIARQGLMKGQDDKRPAAASASSLRRMTRHIDRRIHALAPADPLHARAGPPSPAG